MLHKKHISIFLFYSLLTVSNLYAQNTVAVLDFEGIGVSEDEARALSNRFGTEFLELSGGIYVLVERQQMGEILEEQGLQQSGCVSSECAVEVGAALGAKFIIVGSISKVGNIYSVNVKLLDVETTEVLKSISHDQMGNIGVLLTSGMREAAAKLLGMSSSSEPLATTGTLKIVSLVSGVKLYNPNTDEFMADAPMTAEVIKDMKPGMYSFLARKTGYADKLYEVRVIAGQESSLVISDLDQETGTFTINVDVDSASVFINDEFIGFAPVTTVQLPYNTYTIKVKKKGFEDFSRYQRIESPNEELDFNLKRILPTVLLSISPNNSRLSFNHKIYDPYQTQSFKLDPGTHQLTASKNGYISKTESFQINYGDDLNVSLTLDKAIASITFNVNAPNYTGFEIMGKKKVPLSLLRHTQSGVPFGGHKYQFNASKYEPAFIDVNINSLMAQNVKVNLIRKSRSKAFKKSLILPGLGQSYAENNLKGIVMLGLHVGAGYLIYDNYTKYNDSKVLMNDYYLNYKTDTDIGQMAINHRLYRNHQIDTNNAADLLMAASATFAVNWVLSAVDALLWSGL